MPSAINHNQNNNTMITDHEDNECTTYVIHLDDHGGNAFYLLGMAQKLMEDYDQETRDDVLIEMQGGDYLHLIETFDSHFRNQVTLVSTDSNILSLAQ